MRHQILLRLCVLFIAVLLGFQSQAQRILDQDQAIKNYTQEFEARSSAATLCMRDNLGLIWQFSAFLNDSTNNYDLLGGCLNCIDDWVLLGEYDPLDETVLFNYINLDTPICPIPELVIADGGVDLVNREISGTLSTSCGFLSGYLSNFRRGACIDAPVEKISAFEALNINPELSAAPNPASSQTALFFSLHEATAVSLTLYSVTGQLVKQVFNGQLESGNQQLTIDVAGLNPGIYTAVLNQQGNRASQLIVVQ